MRKPLPTDCPDGTEKGDDGGADRVQRARFERPGVWAFAGGLSFYGDYRGCQPASRRDVPKTSSPSTNHTPVAPLPLSLAGGIEGGAGAEVTVNVAVLLVTLPNELATTTV
jgi:hypothetical protein